MTEKQIEQLKKMLSDAHSIGSTDELDNQILEAARLESEKLKAESTVSRGGSWLKSLGSLGVAAMLTVIVFLGLSQVLSPDDLVVKKASTQGVDSVAFESTEAGSSAQPLSENTIVKPSNRQLSSAPSSGSRDDILMQFDLGETEDLLANLSNDLFGDAGVKQGSIRLAMNDINSLIKIGEFDGARQRYRDFAFDCKECDLPASLEDLVLAASSGVRASDSKDNTG